MSEVFSLVSKIQEACPERFWSFRKFWKRVRNVFGRFANSGSMSGTFLVVLQILEACPERFWSFRKFGKHVATLRHASRKFYSRESVANGLELVGIGVFEGKMEALGNFVLWTYMLYNIFLGYVKDCYYICARKNIISDEKV